MDIREFKPIILLLLLAVAVVVLVLSGNDLIFGNTSLVGFGLTLTSTGNWEYWIFTGSFIFSVLFGYMFYSIARDARKFYTIVEKGTKLSLTKNLKDVQKIAKRLGPAYEEKLAEASKKWNVR